MKKRTQYLRDLLVSHEAWDPYGVALHLLDIVDEQQERIKELERLLVEQADLIKDLARTSVRQSENIVQVGKRIDRLQRIHGA